MNRTVLLALAAGLTALGAAGPVNARPDGANLFQQQCAACHGLDAAPGKFGPPLRGVVDRRAAAAAGYPYSDALKELRLRWTPHELDEFLAAPDRVAPGTRMMASVADPASRAALIAYLKAQGPRPGAPSRGRIRR